MACTGQLHKFFGRERFNQLIMPDTNQNLTFQFQQLDFHLIFKDYCMCTCHYMVRAVSQIFNAMTILIRKQQQMSLMNYHEFNGSSKKKLTVWLYVNNFIGTFAFSRKSLFVDSTTLSKIIWGKCHIFSKLPNNVYVLTTHTHKKKKLKEV